MGPFCVEKTLFCREISMCSILEPSLLDVIIVWFFSLSGLSKPVITNHNFLAVYFDHRHKDLKLLLNLLAETSGLPESFRILTLFDKKFQSLWKPQNLRFEEYETVGSVTQVVYREGSQTDSLFVWSM